MHRATLLEPHDGRWRVSYYDLPFNNIGDFTAQSTHPFRWLARLHAWLYMNGYREAESWPLN